MGSSMLGTFNPRWPFKETSPLQGYISALVLYPSGNTHNGKSGWGDPMDISTNGKTNWNVYAAESGTASVDVDSSYGNYVIITHSNSAKSIYAHLASVSITDGDTVSANFNGAISTLTTQHHN
jgi:murein DD-endopeptidase MepM/ murein hydrolase activator NlpD